MLPAAPLQMATNERFRLRPSPCTLKEELSAWDAAAMSPISVHDLTKAKAAAQEPGTCRLRFLMQGLDVAQAYFACGVESAARQTACMSDSCKSPAGSMHTECHYRIVAASQDHEAIAPFPRASGGEC